MKIPEMCLVLVLLLTSRKIQKCTKRCNIVFGFFFYKYLHLTKIVTLPPITSDTRKYRPISKSDTCCNPTVNRYGMTSSATFWKT